MQIWGIGPLTAKYTHSLGYVDLNDMAILWKG